MTYRISRRANADIEAICDYIAQDNLAAANRLDLRIHTTIEMLSQFPRMGHSRRDVSDKRYRFWTVGSYVVAYRMQAKQLIVVRVLHGAHDFRKLFQTGSKS
jgi:plasmid stabilization system protein ParE